MDLLQRTFYAQALDGDVASGALVAKLIERRCTILGLYTPPATTLEIIEAQAPRKTSADRIRAAFDRVRGKRLPWMGQAISIRLRSIKLLHFRA